MLFVLIMKWVGPWPNMAEQGKNLCWAKAQPTEWGKFKTIDIYFIKVVCVILNHSAL
jgi:hypothetical protein